MKQQMIRGRGIRGGEKKRDMVQKRAHKVVDFGISASITFTPVRPKK